MPPGRCIVTGRIATVAWACWTVIRASAEYLVGRISEDELRTRTGIARLAVGKEDPDLRSGGQNDDTAGQP
jgi:hypothetical protein